MRERRRISGKVVVLGSLNVDLVTRVERHPRPGETLLGEGLARLAGGKGGNQAIAAADAGASVRMVGAVGSDEAGRAYLTRLSARGVDVRGVSVVDGPSGHALVAVAADGENSIIVIPGANAAVNEGALTALDDLGPGDVLLVQLEIPLPTVIAAVRLAAHRGARVVVNIAPYAALPPDVIAAADPLVANEHESVLLGESGALPASLVVTFGANGAAWNGAAHPAVPVPVAEVLDTTGAGDAFCGVLAAYLARGADHDEAMAAALVAGAAAVRYAGAQPNPVL